MDLRRGSPDNGSGGVPPYVILYVPLFGSFSPSPCLIISGELNRYRCAANRYYKSSCLSPVHELEPILDELLALSCTHILSERRQDYGLI